MARWLSAEWFADVNATAAGGAAGALRAATAGASVTVQQVVAGGPGGEVRYWVRVAGGAVELGPGDAPGGADATVVQSWDTAAALQRGELDVATALLDGRVRVAGDVGRLVEHQAALAGVAGPLAAVRDRTTFG